MCVCVLMQAAVKTSLVDLDICPPFALLLAYKYYEPAIRWVTRSCCKLQVGGSFVVGRWPLRSFKIDLDHVAGKYSKCTSHAHGGGSVFKGDTCAGSAGEGRVADRSASVRCSNICQHGNALVHLAVSPRTRHRVGIGLCRSVHLIWFCLLRLGLALAVPHWQGTMLFVYQHSVSAVLACTHPACRLYESWGFQHTPWVDPAWQEDAEKGRMVRQRRVMMIKPLSGPTLSPAHLRKAL
jgi:hypothetical protein